MTQDQIGEALTAGESTEDIIRRHFQDKAAPLIDEINRQAQEDHDQQTLELLHGTPGDAHRLGVIYADTTGREAASPLQAAFQTAQAGMAREAMAAGQGVIAKLAADFGPIRAAESAGCVVGDIVINTPDGRSVVLRADRKNVSMEAGQVLNLTPAQRLQVQGALDRGEAVFVGSPGERFAAMSAKDPDYAARLARLLESAEQAKGTASRMLKQMDFESTAAGTPKPAGLTLSDAMRASNKVAKARKAAKAAKKARRRNR